MVLNIHYHYRVENSAPSVQIVERLNSLLVEKLSHWDVKLIDSQSIAVESVTVKLEESDDRKICISWNNQDEDLGRYILGLVQNIG